jgi:hypothetical protein
VPQKKVATPKLGSIIVSKEQLRSYKREWNEKENERVIVTHRNNNKDKVDDLDCDILQPAKKQMKRSITYT